MTREELKEHCNRQIDNYEKFYKIHPVTLNDMKRYSEHKMVLDMIEKLDKIEQIMKEYETLFCSPCFMKNHKCAKVEIKEVLDHE